MIYQKVALHNVAEVLPTPLNEGVYLTRIPETVRAAVNERARSRALWTAGCEVRFVADAPVVEVLLSVDEATPREGLPIMAEVYRGPYVQGYASLGPGITRVRCPQSANPLALRQTAGATPLFSSDVWRVLLPHLARVRLMGIDAHGGQVRPPEPGQYPRRRWLAYGSSITQGALTLAPSGTYVARTARRLGCDALNLGFGAAALCDAALAAHVASRDDWDLATLELGVNMFGAFALDDFAAHVRRFVRPIAAAHPDKPVVCLTMFILGGDFTGDQNQFGSTLAEYRQAVRDVVSLLRLPNLHLIEGTDLLGDPTLLGTDLVHPGDAGMERIAEALVPRLRPLLL
ncbi:MAG: hypothetical protein HY321_15120 [Armatimonadetes bacterium]|nr:hypothetical protein [Armatimonadota bacterium]